jgi:two-component system OmpR family response regulator
MFSAQLNRVMHVDDMCDIGEVTQLALESIGNYTVCSCESGADPLEKLSGFSPEIIPLDVMMPEMSGPDVLLALTKMPRGIGVPVVFYDRQGPIERFGCLKALGAIDVIPKPFDTLALSDQVAKIWGRHVRS